MSSSVVPHPDRPRWVQDGHDGVADFFGVTAFTAVVTLVVCAVITGFADLFSLIGDFDFDGYMAYLWTWLIMSGTVFTGVEAYYILSCHVMPRKYPSTVFATVEHANAERKYRSLDARGQSYVQNAYDCLMADTMASGDNVKLFTRAHNLYHTLQRQEIKSRTQPLALAAQSDITILESEIDRLKKEAQE